MFKVKRNAAASVGIDCLLASFSSIVVFSVSLKFAILVHCMAFPCNRVDGQGTFIRSLTLAGETFPIRISRLKVFE